MNAADERARGVREYVRVRRENEKLQARLRAAEEVVEAVRQVNEPLPKDWSVDETAWTWAHERFVEGPQDALRRYDKAVKE